MPKIAKFALACLLRAGVIGLIAVIFLLTSLVGTCLAYLPFGLSTCKESGSKA